MKITEGQLRRIIRQEVQALREMHSPLDLNPVDPSGGGRFSVGTRGTWQDTEEFPGIVLRGVVVDDFHGMGFMPDAPSGRNDPQARALRILARAGIDAGPGHEPMFLVDEVTGAPFFIPE